MNTQTRWALDPATTKGLDTEELRDAFLIESPFVPGEINLTYSHYDRMVVGGAVLAGKTLKLESFKALGTDNFLDRREAVIANIGEQGTVTVDGTTYTLGNRDMLYIARETRDVTLSGENAKFYIVSAPAHATHKNALIRIGDANRIDMGAKETCNERSLYQYVYNGGVESCQIVMGMTTIAPGSVWNTMPAHLHERRTEAYLYFDMPEDVRVFHFMGEPHETRHMVIANEQALLSPGWSIHSGAGTGSYTFVWAMAGDNMDFKDMDMVAMEDLR